MYTVDTLAGAFLSWPDDELFLILGGDQAASLASWRSPEEVLSLAVVAVAERDEWRRSSIIDRLGPLGSSERLRFFDMPRVEISSSFVRRRARPGSRSAISCPTRWRTTWGRSRCTGRRRRRRPRPEWLDERAWAGGRGFI